MSVLPKQYPIFNCMESECSRNSKFVTLIQKMTKDKVCPFLSQDVIKAELNHILTGRMSPNFITISLENIVGLGLCVEGTS